MSMTYYAVTDDPNELTHWGVKGMKWGVRNDKPRHTGSKPRSVAYKRAQNKLGKMMKSGIKKAEAHWKEYNSPKNKKIRAAKRYERQTERALEKARKGKLKYGKLDDNQIRRITQRLTMENQARQLSDREKSFSRRLRESISQGIITGVGSGVGSMVSESIGRKSKLKTDRLRGEQNTRIEKEKARQLHNQQKDFERQDNSKRNQKRKAKEAVRQEYYNEAVKRGQRPNRKRNASRVKQLNAWKASDAREARRKEAQKLINDTYYRTYAVQRAQANFSNKNKGRGNNQTNSILNLPPSGSSKPSNPPKSQAPGTKPNNKKNRKRRGR